MDIFTPQTKAMRWSHGRGMGRRCKRPIFIPAPPMAGSSFGDGGEFSYTTPGLLYYFQGSQTTCGGANYACMASYNIASGSAPTPTQVYDFGANSACYPSGSPPDGNVTWGDPITVSADDQTFATGYSTFGGGQGSGVMVVVWNRTQWLQMVGCDYQPDRRPVGDYWYRDPQRRDCKHADDPQRASEPGRQHDQDGFGELHSGYWAKLLGQLFLGHQHSKHLVVFHHVRRAYRYRVHACGKRLHLPLGKLGSTGSDGELSREPLPDDAGHQRMLGQLRWDGESSK